ncbi:WD repeat- and FYVE domain-containing protein 4 [Rhinatrema bivittatum]|uniref:WD repeat- and FYVE domain-containing protein 4 n=1 Tax=Rhinatrema bivittatum TaxID=194408 RepID=UPI00112D371D|nr:WD repeat- and FYVE domain-containing protein 4 [Rhinatrema bivittatum]XP_029465485.1 WD repeat- and FYVE domain-containing protein 4 [Rhinatrema bivittatum]
METEDGLIETQDIMNKADQEQVPNSEDINSDQPDFTPKESQHPMELWETLSKQFQDYQQSSQYLIPEEQQNKLWQLLPLFLKACEHTAGVLSLPNTDLLGIELSRLLAIELRKKISNKPAEEARRVADQFLQRKGGVENEGYLLLKSVYLLSHTDHGVLRNIMQTGLLDVLSQCLYLFFAFPPVQESVKEEAKPENHELPAQELFIRIMLNACSLKEGVVELLRTTELQSLITSVALLWDQCSPSWRAPTSHLLKTISKTLTESALHHLQSSKCIKMSFQNLSRSADTLSPCDLCEVASILLGFVKHSYPISQALLLEFENNEGYQLVLKIVLRCGRNSINGGEHHLDDLLNLLVHLTMCGKTELKVAGNVSHPQLMDFQYQQEPFSETTVKNLQVFQVLQSVFEKTNDVYLCRKMLSTIKTIWALDKMNFFLLEWTLQPISQFVEVIHLKPHPVQLQFFQLIEYVVFELSYIPHEILKKLQVLIKENCSWPCTVIALECIQSITRRDELFNDIFRDSGLLGMLLAHLRKQAKLLRKSAGSKVHPCEQESDKELTCVRLKLVATLVLGSVRNTVVIKDYGMVPFIKIFLDEDYYRGDALSILEQLSVINTEEYMSTIVGALCSSTQGEVQFKLDLLKSLLRILRTPKGRSAFRSASGFNGLLSVLSDMEGALSDPPSNVWATVETNRILELILYTLKGISAALYLDPVNSDFFRKHELFEKMAEDMELLGCFCTLKSRKVAVRIPKGRTFIDFIHLVSCSVDPFPSCLKSCITLFSFLDCMIKGTLHLDNSLKETEKTKAEVPASVWTRRPDGQEVVCTMAESCVQKPSWKCDTPNYKSIPDSENRFDGTDPVMVHPGAVCVLVRLLQHVYSKEEAQISKEIQCSVANHILSWVKSDKNRQVLCEAGLLNTIVTYCRDVLNDSADPLHLQLVRIFEKLASQAIKPDVLRQFLCLGMAPVTSSNGPKLPNALSCPRNTCSSEENQEHHHLEAESVEDDGHLFPTTHKPWLSRSSAKVLQTSVNLVSMTSPRNFQLHKVASAPSFIEFDMSSSGHGCLFLPTLATVFGTNAEHSVSGGIGEGTRGFPPHTGFTFSSWFLISKFSNAHDAHSVRFLTVVRHMSRTEQKFVCFSISISPLDHSLIISTEEEEFQPLDNMEPEITPSIYPTAPTKIQFNCSRLLAVGQWHHVAVVVSKEIKRNSIVSAYIDGQIIGSAKMQYIQSLPGDSVALEHAAFVDVYGFIATPKTWKQKSSLVWRLGPTYLFEETVLEETLQVINRLGPSYCGNFQAVQIYDDYFMMKPVLKPLVSEEKISFGISIVNSSLNTIMDIKTFYNEVDSRLIANEMNVSSRDNVMPIVLARNSAGHLSGAIRTIGAATVGYYGVRVFNSNPAANSLNFIGGPAILLELIAMALDDHALYAAVKVLHSVQSSNAMSEKLIKHMDGYRLLAFLLKKKARLLNSRIFHLLLSMVGTADHGFGSLAIQNHSAFQHILCDFELWLNTPDNLDLVLFSHLITIFKDKSHGSSNAEVAHQMQVVPKLLFLLNDPNLSQSKVTEICKILIHLLKGHFNTLDILRIGLFLVYTLKPPAVRENQISLDRLSDLSNEALSQTSGRTIWLRNQLLKMLLDLINSDQVRLSLEKQEDMFLALGCDWFLLFVQGHLHPETVILGMKLLVSFLYNPNLLVKFKEWLPAGAWVENNRAGLDNLMDNLKYHPTTTEGEIQLISGFAILQVLVIHHVHMPEVYRLLLELFLQTPLDEPIGECHGNLDSLLQWALQNHNKDHVLKVGLCMEAAVLLLEIVKTVINKPATGTEDSWEITYPGSVIQFFCIIYHSYPCDPVWISTEFLQTLTTVIFSSGTHMSGQEAICQDLSQAVAGKICSDDSATSLHVHPAKKQVCNFVRILLMDSLINIPLHKQCHPLELLLEVSVEDTTYEQKKNFQTEILLSAIDIFHVINHDDSKMISAGSKGNGDTSCFLEGAGISVGNISYFSQKLVDKLYSGMFASNPQHILCFITEQITMVMDNAFSQRENIFTSLYSSLNRAILYCLSRSRQLLTELLNLLYVLKVLLDQLDIIFATYNSNINFITCLMHCLFQIKTGSYPEGFGVEPEPLRPTWHQIFLVKDEKEEGGRDFPSPHDVQEEILKLVEVVWDQLISQRRQTLEDAYKIDLSVKQGDRESEVKIAEVTPLWEETAAKSWQHYLASEKKNRTNKSPSSQTQQGKTNPFLSSAMRLMQGRHTKETECKAKDFLSCMDLCRRTGQDFFSSLYKNHHQMMQCTYSKAIKDWTKIKGQLTMERGLWGSVRGLTPKTWTLNLYEGPARMRKRMQTIMDLKNEMNKTSSSEFLQGREEKQEELMLNDLDSENANQGKHNDQLTFFPALHESLPSEDFFEECIERHVILQEFAEKEKITQKYSIVIVEGHITSEGVLLFGRDHFYICEQFTLSHLGDVYCTIHCISSIKDTFIFNLCNKDQLGRSQTSCRFSYHEIKEIHHMCFLLQEIALEIFFRNGHSKFLVFHNKDRAEVFKRFCSILPTLKSKGVTEDSINIRKNLGGEKTMLLKWQKREISNFEYLMYLNMLAGRTYKDYMQYPVFPWILADYESETLNLTNPQSFRDLSKPMGAQTKERKMKFIQRYKEVKEVEKTDGDLSVQCHYCTHYSSAIIVTSYLVRLEPFTQTFCSLQGGSFDVADRMFHSVKSAWDSASRENMSDVRELIPEFFYLPDFLTNSNQVELGCMQDGTVLGDVVLPPWAAGDPHTFIRLHRQALESDYVSANLHHWIDLIFGSKQYGSAAVENVNVFHPYFYGDKMDLNNITDPLIKSTILGFVNSFGQIPKQLFNKSHPTRNVQGKEAASSSNSGRNILPFFYMPQSLKPTPVAMKEGLRRAVGHIIHTEKSVLAVEKNKILIPPLWNKTFSWGFEDFSCCLGNYGSDKSIVTLETMADWGLCLCAVCPTPFMIITSGTSSVVCVWELSLVKDKVKWLSLKQALYGHEKAVTCLAASIPYSIIVSGSADRTCIVWDLNELNYVTQLPGHQVGVSSVAISDSSGNIVSCAGTYLYLWTVNGQLLASTNTASVPERNILCCCLTELNYWDGRNVIVTGCADGFVRLWKLEFVQVSSPVESVPPRDPALAVEKKGNKREQHLVPCRELNVSEALSGKQKKKTGAVTALALSRNHTKLLVGDDKGKIYCWSMDG